MSDTQQAWAPPLSPRALGRLMTQIEAGDPAAIRAVSALQDRSWPGVTIGITGPPGSGKSTLISALTRELRRRGNRVGILAVDPSSPQTGGAILGDRVRMMEHAADSEVLVRSIASRGHGGGLSPAVADHARLLRASGYAWVLIETVGAGQAEIDIAARADLTLVVQAPGMGDDIQALKKGILEIADLIVVNKSDQPGAAELQRQLGTWAAAPDRVLSLSAESGAGIEALLAAIAARHVSVTEKPAHVARRDEVRTLALARLRERLEVRLATLDLSRGNTWELADELLALLGIKS